MAGLGVGGIARQERDLKVGLPPLQRAFEVGQLRACQLRHLRVGQHRARLVDLTLQTAVGAHLIGDGPQVGVFAGQVGDLGRLRTIVEARFEILETVLDLIEAVAGDHRRGVGWNNDLVKGGAGGRVGQEVSRMPLKFALVLVVACAAGQSAVGEIPCECRDTFGNLHDVGTRLCLTVDGRTFMALCAMSQNVTIWRDTGAACPMG